MLDYSETNCTPARARFLGSITRRNIKGKELDFRADHPRIELSSVPPPPPTGGHAIDKLSLPPC